MCLIDGGYDGWSIYLTKGPYIIDRIYWDNMFIVKEWIGNLYTGEYMYTIKVGFLGNYLFIYKGKLKFIYSWFFY